MICLANVSKSARALLFVLIIGEGVDELLEMSRLVSSDTSVNMENSVWMSDQTKQAFAYALLDQPTMFGPMLLTRVRNTPRQKRRRAVVNSPIVIVAYEEDEIIDYFRPKRVPFLQKYKNEEYPLPPFLTHVHILRIHEHPRT
jgi:hypothetical protein